MDCKNGDLVAEPLGGDDGDYFEDLEVEGHRFQSWCRVADSSHGGGGGSLEGSIYVCA